MNKPPYVIPSMKEITSIPWNRFNVISTFSGCGGSCLGFRMAGFRVLWANEFIPAAQETYKKNHPHSYLNTKDIRSVTGKEILSKVKLRVGEVDVFEGSPPCSSFSRLGHKDTNWGEKSKYSDTVQRTDDLFFEYGRLVQEIQPKYFVAENVAGLPRGRSYGYFKIILEFLKNGYEVKCKILNARFLGIPQSRERLIFIGMRKDLTTFPEFPKPFPYTYSIKDSIDYKSSSDDEIFYRIPDTGKTIEEWKKLKLGERSKKYFLMARTDPNKPSNTICAQPSGTAVMHPLEPRTWSISELKRLCSFPDDFVLTGSIKQKWERLGRSVPPFMMFRVAEKIRNALEIENGR